MLNKNDFKVFNIFLFFWLALGWLSFTLTLSGVFYWWILVIFIALTIALGARFFLGPLMKISRTFIILNLSLFIIITAFSIYSSPTIFSGRDQGAISEAAIRLSQNNQLKFSNSISKDFFEINSTPRKKMANCLLEKKVTQADSLKEKFNNFYCHTISSGRALNFPGFFYTPEGNLSTQFPLVYISWLSFFYSFFGLAGLTIANAILFYIFLVSIFLLSYTLTTRSKHQGAALNAAITTVILTLTSFSFSWFLKFTLTENMAIALIWLGILQVVQLTSSRLINLNGEKMNLLVMLMSFGLLVFTRIEGLALLLFVVLVLLFHKNTANYFRRNFLKIILPTTVIFAAFFVWNLTSDIYFYKAIVKSFAKDFSENATVIDNNYAVSTLNLFKIFFSYGILIPLFVGLFSIAYFLKKKNYKKLIPFFITLPVFIYIFSPQITPDHPWMLRRFVFAILPVSILYTSTLLFSYFHSRSLSGIIMQRIALVIIVALNIPAFFYFFTYATPGKTMLAQTEKLSQYFTENDLVLIDQGSSGDNQQMISAPMNFLFGKNAVYFFNPNDLKEINKEKYDKIYLITPEKNVRYYKESYLGNKLVTFKEYAITTNILTENKDKISFPKKEIITTTGTIFEIKK